jgi:hypothetical protein
MLVDANALLSQLDISANGFTVIYFYNWWWFLNRWITTQGCCYCNKFIEAINSKYGSNLKESI